VRVSSRDAKRDEGKQLGELGGEPAPATDEELEKAILEGLGLLPEDRDGD
jgi:hypothetical protein